MFFSFKFHSSPTTSITTSLVATQSSMDHMAAKRLSTVIILLLANPYTLLKGSLHGRFCLTMVTRTRPPMCPP